MGKRTNTAKWMESQNRWQINVQKDGQRRSFYSSIPGRAGQREANSKADAWLDNGIGDTRIRVEQLYTAFIELKKASTSRSNWRNVDSRWRNHVKPCIGNKQAIKLTENDLQNIINKAYSHGLASKTLRSLRADLVAFCKYCRIEKVTTLLPESLTIPSGAKRPQKRILQPHDLIKLFNIDTTIMRGKRVPEEYIHAYRFEVLTGFRPGEINGLEWADREGDRIHLRRAVNWFGEVTQGKNENAVRVVYLSKFAIAELDAQYKLTGGQKSVFNISCLTTYYKHWARYLESNGMAHTSPYELRHTFVSIAKNLPEGMVKQIVGHSQNMDTWGVYSHRVEGEAEATSHQLNELFSGVLQVKK